MAMSKEINLLPLPRRRQLSRRFFEHSLRRFVASLLLGLMLVSLPGLVALVGFRVAAPLLYPADETGLEEAIVAYRAETRTIQEGNTLIGAMQKVQDDRVEWTVHLPEIFAALPAGTQLYEMTADRDRRQLVIEGQASARSTLVVFETKLKAMSWVKSVTAPPSNLLERVGPEFTFTIAL